MAFSGVLDRLKGAGQSGFNTVRDPISKRMQFIKETFTPKRVLAGSSPAIGAMLGLFEKISKFKNKDQNGDLKDPRDSEPLDDEGEEDDLVAAIEDGFDQTNDSLERIFKVLRGSEDTQKEQSETEEIHQKEDQKVSIQIRDEEDEQSKLLKQVVKNTTPDLMQNKEDDLERKKQKTSIDHQLGNESKKGEGEKKGGILGDLVGGLVGAALARFGLGKAAKAGAGSVVKSTLSKTKDIMAKALGGAKNLAGKALSGGKSVLGKVASLGETALAKGKGALDDVGAAAKPVLKNALAKGGSLIDDIGSGLSKAKPALVAVGEKVAPIAAAGKALVSNAGSKVVQGASKVVPALGAAGGAVADGAKFVGSVGSKALGGAAKVGGKLLGAPLAIGMAGYDAYNISKDKNLTDDQKKQGYSKVSGGAVGALAGAKAGAVVGSMILPGVGTAVGGILGAVGGGLLGEFAGDSIGKFLFSKDKPNEAGVANMAEGKIQKDVSTEMLAKIEQERIKLEDKLRKDRITKVSPSTTPLNKDTPDLSASKQKTAQLKNRADYIKDANVERAVEKSKPVVVQVNNPTTNNVQSGGDGGSKNLGVPSTRDRNGTIERLLDRNFSTILS